MTADWVFVIAQRPEVRYLANFSWVLCLGSHRADMNMLADDASSRDTGSKLPSVLAELVFFVAA